MPSRDALADLDGVAQEWLRLCDALGVTALAIFVTEGAIVVRCIDGADVAPVCRRVLAEHDAPPGRTLN